jgi:hypothetical protein
MDVPHTLHPKTRDPARDGKSLPAGDMPGASRFEALFNASPN